MAVYIRKLANGDLIVPVRGETNKVIGDGFIKIDKNNSDYQKYLGFFNEENQRVKLKDLFLMLKGSQYSGNFGHGGDPPNRGGSSSGGGHLAIGILPNENKSSKLSEYRKDKKFVSILDIEEPLMDSQKDFLVQNKKEVKALRDYSSWTGKANFNRINGPLREGKTPNKIVQKAIDTLDSAFEKAPRIPKDTTVYRTSKVGNDKDGQAYLIAMIGLKPGDKFQDKAFVSTSLNSTINRSGFLGGSQKQVNFKIEVPKGSKGIYIKPISHTKGENELLLPRGQKFEVVSNKTKKDGSIQMVLRIME